ncbi:hypothetical protein HF072_06865 [Bacillus sp. RO3]|nr:hypothetical protein [Bacillus sp. RO3]
MSRYISIFFLCLFVSGILFFIVGSFFMDGGDPAEGVMFLFGVIIVILLSFIISQMYYLIHLVRKKD